MSQKRKRSEYQDPDYLQESGETGVTTKNCNNRIDKICMIIKNELRKDLEIKEKQLFHISNEISRAKTLLHKIRYAVISNYYNKSSIIDSESQQIQQSFHPAIRDILAKTTEDFDELLKLRPTRQAAQTAKTTIKDKLQTKKDKRQAKLKCEQKVEDLKLVLQSNVTSSESTYLMKWEKPVAKINTSRGTNQIRQLIVVGNTSKYIGYENSTDNATHKWLVYCQSRTNSPIEQFVKKIRFLLHDSYKPNNVINITSPPFQLTRRGWGEFPIKLQLFFHLELQEKPLQIVHDLILDKNMTGLQTMGSETLIEIWLRSSFFKENEKQMNFNMSTNADQNIDSNNSDKNKLTIHEDDIKFNTDQHLEPAPCDDLSSDYSLNIEKKNCDSSDTDEACSENDTSCISNKTNEITQNTINDCSKSPINYYKYGKVSIMKPIKKTIIQKRKQQSLLKPQISLLKKSLPKPKTEILVNRYPNPIDHDYTSITRINKYYTKIKNQEITEESTINYQEEFEQIFYLKNFTNENQAIEFLLKSIPLVNSKSKLTNYNNSFPFVVENLKSYHKLIEPKRKSNEWLQAKYFSQLMKNHKQFINSYWTTREILLFSRSHGYSPNIVTSEINSQSKSLKQLIKDAITQDRPMTITSCNFIYDWLNEIKEKYSHNLNKVESDENLDIEKIDEPLNRGIDNRISPMKQNNILLEIPKNLKLEENLVKNSCFDIGIQLKPEEIMSGVSFPAAEMVLAKSLRCFIEDLTRRTIFKLNEGSEDKSVIECHHIKSAISSYKNLDFLTNNYLGILKEN